MCLGYPAQVVAVDDAGATVDDGTRRRRASTLVMPDVAAGEWVLVTTGAIVARLDADEAAEIRAMLVEAGAMRPRGAPDASC